MEFIHTDLWGPSPVASHTNFRYYIHFLDDYSRYTWLFPLKQKSDALAAFIHFKRLVENQFDRKIKQLRTDWGGEFQAFTQLVNENGILFQHSCPHTSEQNGRAERKHRHIVETGLTLLAQAHMPLKYWSYAFQTSIYLINRLPTSVLKGKSPFQVLFSKTPNYQFLKIFGVSCFPCIRPYQHHKFDFHSIKCVNLGYSEAHKGYKCLSPHGRIYITRHVIFNEHEFPSVSGFLNTRQPEQFVTLHTPHTWFNLPSGLITLDSRSGLSPISAESSSSVPAASPSSSSSDRCHSVVSPSLLGSPVSVDSVIPNDAPSSANEAMSSPSVLPTAPAPVVSVHPMITRAKDGIFKPRTFVGHAAFTHSSCLPASAQIALQHEGWKHAMIDEFQALKRNGTWSLVPLSDLPDAHSIVGCKWVFKEKLNADGSFQRYKARLVAKGFYQRPGLEFGETFSPVIKAAIVRVVLTLVVAHDWEVRQVDINNAFLNGVLEEDVFMAQPPVFEDPQQPESVCKLHKSIYEIKQAPRAWYDQLKYTS